MAGVDVQRPVVSDSRPLVLHIVHRFATGGLENGVANLINHMPAQAYRHAVLALTEVTGFGARIVRDDVGFYALNKPPGHGARCYASLLRLLSELKPTVVHSRNLGPLEMQPVAAWAGVPVRVHGEHGRELDDLDGHNRRLQWVRRLFAPFVHHHIALSQDLQRYLVERVGISASRVTQIYNGVDSLRFRPADGGAAAIPGCPFDPARHWLVGTVGRMQGVKNPLLLVRAFLRALQLAPDLRERGRLVLVGDGPLRAACVAELVAAQADGLAWLPGERADVADVMRGLSCFVLPSLAEGISNTILEAMACSLPVLATAVGGNGELLVEGCTGHLLPTGDEQALAEALVRCYRDPEHARAMGCAGRLAVGSKYSLQAMVAAYQRVYDSRLALARRGH